MGSGIRCDGCGIYYHRTCEDESVQSGLCYVCRPHPVPRREKVVKRLRVYIAGPIQKGDLLHNVNQATEAFVALAKAGLAPFCPHWSVYCKPACHAGIMWLYDQPRPQSGGDIGVWCLATQGGGTNMSHKDWLDIDLAWVEVADVLLRLPGESSGADIEVECAKKNGIAVFDNVEHLILWAERESKLQRS